MIKSRPSSQKKKTTIADGEIDVLRFLVKSTLGKQKKENQELVEASFGSVHVNFICHTLEKDGKRIPARTREFRLLKYFLQHEGEVISRDQLLRDVWGYENNPTTRTVDNYILRLRKKIETDPAEPKHILTVHSAGYQFNR